MSKITQRPFRETWRELQTLIPVISLISIHRSGGGKRAVVFNLAILLGIFVLSWLLAVATGDLAQWVSLGFGVYVAFCWGQHLRYADPATFGMMFGSKTYVLAVCGFPFLSFVAYGLGFWGPPYAQRAFGVSASEAGTVMGLCIALGGWIGVTAGGYLADRLKERFVRGRFYICFASVGLCVPAGLGFTLTNDPTTAYVFYFLLSAVSPMWLGCAVATVNDLVLPRMRALASAYYILMLTFIGLALGPYSIGLVSDVLGASGYSPARSLQLAMIVGLGALVPAFIYLYAASRFLPDEEESRIERARNLGESI